MATNLYLIRHGEAFSNVDGIIGGEKGDRGLTERGFTQARALAKRLESGEIAADVLYASTLKRAQQTAELVAEVLKLPIVFDDDLQELRPGDADGMHIDQVREQYPQVELFLREVYTPIAPNGESWGMFQTRIGAVLDRILAAHPQQRIVVVAHGGVIEASFLHFLGLGPQTRSRNGFHSRNTAITHWRYTESDDGPLAGRSEWNLIAHNSDWHLAGLQ